MSIYNEKYSRPTLKSFDYRLWNVGKTQHKVIISYETADETQLTRNILRILARFSQRYEQTFFQLMLAEL